MQHNTITQSNQPLNMYIGHLEILKWAINITS